MALRGMSGASSIGTKETSLSITYAGASPIEVGDLIVLVTCFSTGGGEGTVTDPSGFTPGSGIGLPDNVLVTNDAFIHIAVKIADASDAGTPTYGTTLSAAAYWAQQLRVYSGRANSSIAAAFPRVASTPSTAETNLPYTLDVTGLTADADDDLVLFIGEGDTFGLSTGNSYSASVAGFANLLSSCDTTAKYGVPLLSLDELAVAAGVTGTLAADLTATNAANGAAGAFLLALPALNSGAVSGSAADSTTGSATLETLADLFAAWDRGDVGDIHRKVFTAPFAIASAYSPVGTVRDVFPAAVGSAGTLTLNDCAALADASSTNQVLSLDVSQITAGQPIKVERTFLQGIVVSAVPAGGEFGIAWEGGPYSTGE